MKVISNAEFGGERPLFESHDLRLENVIIRAGESAIKQCSNIEAVDCRFEGNYPFWHVHGFVIDRCFFDVGGRSALWYSDNLKMTNTRIDAPKMFREMHDIEIENVEIKDADEVFWRCKNLDIKNLAFAQPSVGKLSHYRRAAALLRPRPRIGKLYVRPRLRPGFRVQFGAGDHQRRNRWGEESANGLYHRRELRGDYPRREYQGSRRLQAETLGRENLFHRLMPLYIT